jgi:hypothetical protein
MLNRPSKLQNLIEQSNSVIITEAQIRTLRATPVQIVPATPGYLIVPYLCLANKKAGAAYGGGGGATSFRLRYPVYGQITNGFFLVTGLSVTVESLAVITIPNMALNLNSVVYGAGPGQGIGESITFSHDGAAEFTGGSGELKVVTFFWLLPLSLLY